MQKYFRIFHLHIDYIEHLKIKGEAVITYDDFEKINSKLPYAEKYKNPRNLVSKWLNSFQGIYYLSQRKEETYKLDGFGKKSVDKLLESIEKSRNTTLDRFIYGLCIPLIGRTSSKAIANSYVWVYRNRKTKTCYRIFSWRL